MVLFESCRILLHADSFGEPRLERLAKTVTECASNVEWAVCVVNDVLRQAVKIHMAVPGDLSSLSL